MRPALPAHRRSRRVYWRRRALFGGAIVAAVCVLLAGISLIGAWTTPGNQSFKAKWADWLRAHHGTVFANALEQYYYDHHVPPKGGAPKALNSVPTTAPSTSIPGAATTAPPAVVAAAHLPPPTPVPLVVSPALPGEGQWAPTGELVNGRPGMYVAQFRADSVYTSQITSAVWIDPTLLRVTLIPGAHEPGGHWSHPPYITYAELPRTLAAFNGGFRMQDAHGGFYLDGVTEVPLRLGAASVVIYSDGRVDVGAWGREVAMKPGVVAVLQNLVPIVDDGQAAPDATYGDSAIWGSTLKGSTVVARSGIGVTASGALVYVAGPALTAKSLAESLLRAGAVRAMSLDINPEWVTFNLYSHPDPAEPAHVTATKLYPQMQRPADRYLPPTWESRDFFAISVPPSS